MNDPQKDIDKQTELTGTDVPQMMQRLWKEHDEPRDGFEPVPFWLAAIFGGLLFWGGLYIATNDGEYRGDVLDETNPQVTAREVIPQNPEEILELGRKLYSQCAICHQTEGGGITGQHPPLKDSEWVTGDKGTPENLARMTIYGVKGEMVVKGEKYNLPMPGYGGQWKDYQIAAVLTYMRSAWGNKAAPISTELIASVRKAEGSRSTSGSGAFTAAELSKPPAKK